jgi:PRC-barrel domain
MARLRAVSFSPSIALRCANPGSARSTGSNTREHALRSRVVLGQGKPRLPPILEAKMLKKLMVSAAVSALMISGAMAQAEPPKADAPKAEAPKAAPVDAAKFVASQSSDQWVFSKFKGTDVLGPDNAQVGDVNDMLFDKNGKILGLIVGVGGFLGIGEKNVAIEMSSFQPVPPDTGSSSGGGSAMTSRSDDPTMTKLKVTWTKDQLKDAPEFQYYKPPSRTTGAPGGSPTTGMGRPTAPTTPPAGR